MEEVGIVIKCANQIYGIDAGRKKQLAGWGCLAEGCLTGWGSRSAIRLIRFLAGEVGCGLASAFLAILPEPKASKQVLIMKDVLGLNKITHIIV